MSDEPVTLAAIAGLDARVKGAFIDEAERARARQVGAEALAGLGAVAAPFDAVEAILGRLAGTLATPLADILREGWRQDKELRSGIAEGAKRGAIHGEVALHKHTIEASLDPTAEIIVNGVHGPTLRFEVKVSVQLEGLLLVIRDATITAIRAGRITAKLELSYLRKNGDRTDRFPLMAPRTKRFAADTEFPLPLGGIRIV